MKKYLLALICFLAAFGVKAQTFSSTHITVTTADTMYHDSTTCMGMWRLDYHITIDSSFMGDSVRIVDTTYNYLLGTFYNTTGASPWVFTATVDNGGSYDMYVLRGGHMYFSALTTKVTCSIDTLYGITASDSLLVNDPCDWSYVSGHAYVDNDSNCILSSGDAYLQGLPINYVEYLTSPVDSLNWGGLPTDTFGYYSYTVQVSWMRNYVVSLPSYCSFIFPPSPCHTSSTYTLSVTPYDTADFPVRCSSLLDVQCGALSSEKIRLHRDFYLEPYVSNTGCVSASGTMTLVLDSRVIYDSALSTLPADTVRGDTLIWNYAHLSSVSSGAYWNSFLSSVYLSLDSTLRAGDTLCFRVYTNVPTYDVNPANNDYSFCLPVVYSFDPNSKDVSPAGPITSRGDTLTYTIHFQNTGSDVAENIRVVDTLDSRFNMSSLKILATSHQMTPKWLASNVVEFDYNNINLPDSTTNEPASHGVVKFSIALQPGIPYGTQIKNTGYIYFDLNSPVITNTATNTITRPASITNVSASLPVKIYPNPATDLIYVENLAGGELSIISMNGSMVMSRNIDANKTSIDVSSLADGVYIIKTVNNNATSTIKFTKQ